jgi:alanyl aminopeptidase
MDSRAFAGALVVALLGAGAVSCGATPKSPRAKSEAAPTALLEPDPAPPPRADGRLPPGVTPKSYRLELTVDPAQREFFGRARIAVRLEQPTRALVLHGRDLTVHTAALRGSAGTLWAKARSRPAAGSKGIAEELVLVLERSAPAGDAEIDVEYRAPFSEGLRGLYRVKDGDRWFAFTQFEPNDARRAFPAFDEPAFKVPMELAVTVPNDLRAFANTPVARRLAHSQSGLITFEFAASPPLATYLVALAVGPLEALEGPREPVPIGLVTVPGKTRLGALALDEARVDLSTLSEYFDEPYPYAKLDLVAVPEFAAGAMENPGLVTFREELLLLDPAQASGGARRALAGVVAHELAHMWFGNLVTMYWWDDLWLNEAFATWMAAKVVDRHHPAYAAGLEALARKSAVMSVDALSSARKVRQPVRSTSEALEAFDGITYVKGMSILAMVESWIGQDAFQRALRSYIKRHRFANARARDLFVALSEASGHDVAAVLDGFVDQTGVPLLSVELDCGAERGKRADVRLRLAQREYRPLGRSDAGDVKSWRFPACVHYDAPKGKGRQCALIDAPVVTLKLETERCPRWFWPNADQAGYFRTALPAPALLEHARYAARRLSEQERVGLVGDAWALVRSGDLPIDTYLELLTALRDEKSRVVWEQIAESLDHIDLALVGAELRPAFSAWVNRLVERRLRELSFEARPADGHDERLLRAVLLRVSGGLGRDEKTLERSAALARQWLDKAASIDADLARAALPLAARRNGAALFDELVARLRRATLPEERLIALAGLTGVSEPALVQRVLGFSLDGTIKLQDLRYVFGPLFGRPETRDAAYDWIKVHFDELKKKIPSFVLVRTSGVMASLCDSERVTEAERFLSPRLGGLEGAERQLSQAAESGRVCAALAARHRSDLQRALHASKGKP